MGQLIKVAELVPRNELPYNAHYGQTKIVAERFESNLKTEYGNVSFDAANLFAKLKKLIISESPDAPSV
jgi:hypothetical protein